MRKHMLASLVVLVLLAGCSTTGSAPTTAPVSNQPTNPAPAQTPASYPTPADGNVVVEPTLEPGQYPAPNSQPTAYPTP